MEGSFLDLTFPVNLSCGLMRVLAPVLCPKILIFPPKRRRTIRVYACLKKYSIVVFSQIRVNFDEGGYFRAGVLLALRALRQEIFPWAGVSG